jgi:hypothetical protein
MLCQRCNNHFQPSFAPKPAHIECQNGGSNQAWLYKSQVHCVGWSDGFGGCWHLNDGKIFDLLFKNDISTSWRMLQLQNIFIQAAQWKRSYCNIIETWQKEASIWFLRKLFSKLCEVKLWQGIVAPIHDKFVEFHYIYIFAREIRQFVIKNFLPTFLSTYLPHKLSSRNVIQNVWKFENKLATMGGGRKKV